MHVTDIEDCLKRKVIRGIEGAFRALVGYPKRRVDRRSYWRC